MAWLRQQSRYLVRFLEVFLHKSSGYMANTREGGIRHADQQPGLVLGN